MNQDDRSWKDYYRKDVQFADAGIMISLAAAIKRLEVRKDKNIVLAYQAFHASKTHLLNHLTTAFNTTSRLDLEIFDAFSERLQRLLDDARLADLEPRLNDYRARYMEIPTQAGLRPQLSESQPRALPGPSRVPPASARNRHQPSLPQLHQQPHPSMPAARGPDAEESWESYYANKVKGKKHSEHMRSLTKTANRWSDNKQDFVEFTTAKDDLQKHLREIYSQRMRGMSTDLIAAYFVNFERAFQRLIADERLKDMKGWLEGYGARYKKIAILAGLGPQLSDSQPDALPRHSEVLPASARDQHPPSLPRIWTHGPVPEAVRGPQRNVTDQEAEAEAASFDDLTSGIDGRTLPSFDDLIKGMREYQRTRGATRAPSPSDEELNSSRLAPPYHAKLRTAPR